MKPLAAWTEEELRAYAAGEFDPHELQESEIKWLSEAPFRIEEIALLGLTPDEIVRVAFLMQIALRDMRQLVHVTVEQVALITRERDTARRQLADTRRR